MTSPSRLLVPLWAALAVAAPSPGAPVAHSPRTAQRTASTGPIRDLVTVQREFAASLERWRGGEDAELPRTRALAAEFGQIAGRPDVPAGVASYERLSRDDRVKGSRFELEVSGLEARFRSAHDAGMHGEEWARLRDELELRLEELVEESRGMADLAARAHATALRADFRIARLESGPTPEIEVEDYLGTAESDARSSISDYTSFGIVKGRLHPLLSLARIERFSGRLDAAYESFQRLADLATTVGNQEFHQVGLLGLLSIARERGDMPDIDRCLGALAMSAQGLPSWDLVREWCMQRLHEDRPDDAQDYLERSWAKGLDGRAHESERREYHYLRALVHLRRGDVEAGRREAERSAALVRRSCGETVEMPFDQDYLEASLDLAGGRPELVLARLEPHVQRGFTKARNEGAARSLLGAALLALRDFDGAVSELERALAIAEAQRLRLAAETLADSESRATFNVLGEWEGAGLETVALLARAKLESGDAVGAALTCEVWQSGSLRGALNRGTRGSTSPTPGVPEARLDREALAKWAGLTELGLVTWVFGADSGVVVHVRRTPDGRLDADGRALPLGREQLRRAVTRIRRDARRGMDCTRHAAELADAVLPEPMRERIRSFLPQGREPEKLLLLLHGHLETMPVEMVPLLGTDSGIELNMMALPGLPARTPTARSDSASFTQWTLLGDPLTSGEGGPTVLGLAGEELAGVARIWGPSRATAIARFSRAEVETALQGTRCLHVATHLESAEASGDRRFSSFGLQLDGGEVLTASRIAAITPRLPLVFLSACETAGGRYSDGEGILGVARAFLESGTRNLVVTLWPVTDSAARDFALAFHRQLEQGHSPSEAVMKARGALRAAGRGPGDWAAFRFLGQD